MPAIDNAAVEAAARALLRERIEHSPWYPALSDQERREAIEADVERYWPTMVSEAAKGLIESFCADRQREGEHTTSGMPFPGQREPRRAA